MRVARVPHYTSEGPTAITLEQAIHELEEIAPETGEIYYAPVGKARVDLEAGLQCRGLHATYYMPPEPHAIMGFVANAAPGPMERA